MARTIHVSLVESGKTPHIKMAMISGLIGGAVFLVLEILLVATIIGDSPWNPVRMIGAILLGREVLPPPGTFDLGIFLAASLVHFALSALLGIVVSFLIYRLEEKSAVMIGALFGIALYFINFYIFTEAFPWFAEARNGVTLFAHIVFGAVTAYAYKEMVRREVQRVPVKVI